MNKCMWRCRGQCLERVSPLLALFASAHKQRDRRLVRVQLVPNLERIHFVHIRWHPMPADGATSRGRQIEAARSQAHHGNRLAAQHELSAAAGGTCLCVFVSPGLDQHQELIRENGLQLRPLELKIVRAAKYTRAMQQLMPSIEQVHVDVVIQALGCELIRQCAHVQTCLRRLDTRLRHQTLLIQHLHGQLQGVAVIAVLGRVLQYGLEMQVVALQARRRTK